MKKFFEEFKTFISRGNVMDMAVGVVVGGAFTSIVNSLVNDIIMPLIALLTGGMDFSSLCIVIGKGEEPATLNYGNFISAIINFLLISFVVFTAIKAINKFRINEKKEKEVPVEKECPYCKSKIAIAATRCPHCTSELE